MGGLAPRAAPVLHDVYLHCTNDQEDIVSQRWSWPGEPAPGTARERGPSLPAWADTAL
jgi:hypothetical protein